MNRKPISDAKEDDLRLSMALERTALGARGLAERTGTELIINRDGVIEWVAPAGGVYQSREPKPFYKDENGGG